MLQSSSAITRRLAAPRVAANAATKEVYGKAKPASALTPVKKPVTLGMGPRKLNPALPGQKKLPASSGARPGLGTGTTANPGVRSPVASMPMPRNPNLPQRTRIKPGKGLGRTNLGSRGSSPLMRAVGRRLAKPRQIN